MEVGEDETFGGGCWEVFWFEGGAYFREREASKRRLEDVLFRGRDLFSGTRGFEDRDGGVF